MLVSIHKEITDCCLYVSGIQCVCFILVYNVLLKLLNFFYYTMYSFVKNALKFLCFLGHQQCDFIIILTICARKEEYVH